MHICCCKYSLVHTWSHSFYCKYFPSVFCVFFTEGWFWSISSVGVKFTVELEWDIYKLFFNQTRKTTFWLGVANKFVQDRKGSPSLSQAQLTWKHVERSVQVSNEGIKNPKISANAIKSIFRTCHRIPPSPCIVPASLKIRKSGEMKKKWPQFAHCLPGEMLGKAINSTWLLFL